jgi:alpha-beta hydrolase superfamily lysophospholipase
VSCILEDVMEETNLVISLARERFPDLPIFLYGFSLGAAAMMQLMLENGAIRVSDVILEAPGLFQRAGNWAAGRFLARFFNAVAPTRVFRSQASEPGSEEAQLLLRHPDAVRGLTARMIHSMLVRQKRVRETAVKWPAEVRLLIEQGADAAAIDVAGVVAWARAVGAEEGRKVTIHVHEGGPHSLLESACRDAVLENVRRFLAESGAIE